jgi:hypothetical protein
MIELASGAPAAKRRAAGLSKGYPSTFIAVTSVERI